MWHCNSNKKAQAEEKYNRAQPWDFFEGMMLKLKLQYFGHLM